MNQNRRKWIALASAALLAITGLLILIYPYGASFLLRFLKSRIDVFFMYGSTAGKALYLPLFLALSLPVMNWNRKISNHRRARDVSLASISLLAIVIWFVAFHLVGETFRKHKLNPYEVGHHFQFCNDGNYFTEFVSFEHTHSLKEVASKVLVGPQQYHTGEDYSLLYDFNVLPSAILIVLALLMYVASLLLYQDLSASASVAYIAGFYMTFFSFFDGGVLNGIHGLFFMFLPRIKNIWKMILAYFLFFIAGIGVFGLYFLLEGQSASWHDVWIQMRFFIVPLLWTRGVVFAFFLILFLRAEAKWIRVLCLTAFVALYWKEKGAWWLNEQYNRPIKKGEEVTLQVHSKESPPFGKVLVRAKNLSVFQFEAEKDTDAWNLCWDTLHEMEGTSYRSLMVVVYCQQLQLSKHYEKTVEFVTLEKGSCGFTCSPELSKYYKVEEVKSDLWRIHGMPNVRDYGVIPCLLPVTKWVTKPLALTPQ